MRRERLKYLAELGHHQQHGVEADLAERAGDKAEDVDGLHHCVACDVPGDRRIAQLEFARRVQEAEPYLVKLLVDFFCDGIEPAESTALSADVRPLPTQQIAASSILSRRELEVLRLLAAGETNAQIARRLGLSMNTIERHVANIYGKINARGRADATAYALRHGLS